MKAKKFGKLITSMLIAGTLVGTLAACGGDTEKDGTSDSGTAKISEDQSKGAMEDYKAGDTFKATEDFTVTSMFSDHANYPYNEDWLFYEKLAETTGVSFDMTVIPASDYEQKRSLMISAGESPIIIPKTYPGSETAFVSSGAILPVSDYIDYMPNFKEKAEKWDVESTLDTLRQKDGKYYVLPGMHEVAGADYTLMYRKDILDENGWEVPETWEEFETLLKNMKEKYPDKTPFSDMWTGQALMNYAAPSFGTSAGWGYNAQTFDWDKNEYVYTGATDEYKDFVSYFAGLVEQGLMDNESFTQDDDQAKQKFLNGDSFVMSCNGQTLIETEETMTKNLGEGNFELVKGLNPEGPAGALVGGNQLENGIMISSKITESPNFKAILQFIDWLWYSDEGQEFARWGVEGTTYTKEDGKYKLAENINYRGLNPSGTEDLQKDYGFSGGNYAYGGSKELVRSIYTDKEVEWLEEMDAKRERVKANPPAPLDGVTQEEMTLVATPVKDYVDQSTLQFITGQRDLSEWDDYVKEVKEKGADRYIEAINKAYEDYKKENG